MLTQSKSFWLSISITLIILLSCCSKFDDGPRISFRKAEERWQGEWILKYFTADGVDSLQYWNNYFGNECMFTFERFESYECPVNLHWGISDSIYYNVQGSHDGLCDDYFCFISFRQDTSS